MAPMGVGEGMPLYGQLYPILPPGTQVHIYERWQSGHGSRRGKKKNEWNVLCSLTIPPFRPLVPTVVRCRKWAWAKTIPCLCFFFLFLALLSLSLYGLCPCNCSRCDYWPGRTCPIVVKQIFRKLHPFSNGRCAIFCATSAH